MKNSGGNYTIVYAVMFRLKFPFVETLQLCCLQLHFRPNLSMFSCFSIAGTHVMKVMHLFDLEPNHKSSLNFSTKHAGNNDVNSRPFGLECNTVQCIIIKQFQLLYILSELFIQNNMMHKLRNQIQLKNKYSLHISVQ